LTERQPGGRFAYEYVKGSYPPLAETDNVTLSPADRLLEEAVKEMIEGSALTISCVPSLLLAPRRSVTVQITFIVPGVL
jgi:hypothetical protein